MVTKNLIIGQLLVFYLLPMLPNRIPLKIFGYNLKIFYESIGIYVNLLKLSNFCLSFLLTNIHLISPKYVNIVTQRKSFRIARDRENHLGLLSEVLNDRKRLLKLAQQCIIAEL